ncbi:MAG: exodeoxyribonuclease VII large subunit [Gammaproteobacteria bacterium]|nr:exodeoxyribonuclease VII large subunit [Gammaproteobacteria bacterium]
MLKPVLQPRRPTERQYITVTELNRKVKHQLEDSVGQVLIEGEISNFIAAGSGHWYFTLKDDAAQVKCTMWRNRNQLSKFRPESGMKVYARAKVSLYEARGDYQLNIDYLEPAGLGNLQLQFEQLKQKLTEEGLLDPAAKKSIPKNISRIGLITSPTGAAIKDVITVMQRRFPLIEIIVYPCQVQGKNAHSTVISALEIANKRKEVDVLLITRGGGSLEDMWCFNHESLAYAIANSELPTVAAIGHEVDFSIAEFVADLRAPTPSAAAELLTPDQHQLLQQIDSAEIFLQRSVKRAIKNYEQTLLLTTAKLKNPVPLLDSYAAQLNQNKHQLINSVKEQLSEQQHKLSQLQVKLLKTHPEKQLNQVDSSNKALKERLMFSMQTFLKQRHEKLASKAQQLNSISPLATLARGYSITLKDDKLIHSSNQVSIGDTIQTRLGAGKITSEITKIDD